ncbi:MAG: cache domain-containing protein [Dokdonella sp.]|nr:cache domain-containing protein [Dokdonella sp.]
MSAARFSSLRGRFLLLVVGVFFGVGALSVAGFLRVADGIIESLGAGYAKQYASQSRGAILARIQRELVLAQKLVASPLLRQWAADEENPELRRLALAELDSYRELFADHSYFFAIDRSRNYYFNNAENEFAGRELRYRLDPADPTLAWYFATIQKVDRFDLHVDNNPQLGVTKLWINAIVRGEDGTKLGVGGSGLDLSAFLREIVRSVDPGVEVWLSDDAGTLQGHPDDALIQSNATTRDEQLRKTIYDLVSDEAERAQLRAALDALARAGKPGDAQLVLTAKAGAGSRRSATCRKSAGRRSSSSIRPRSCGSRRSGRSWSCSALRCWRRS